MKADPNRDRHIGQAEWHWSMIMMMICYVILAITAFFGWHQPFLVGTCYLALSLLVAKIHSK